MRVLLVMADDCGLDLYFHREARHPTLDRMAAEGRVYPICYGAPVCSNFRAGLLTGLEAHRPANLVGKNIQAGDSYSVPTSSGALLPQLVDTWWTGKWHAAQHSNLTHPTQAGCQEFRGSMANFDPPWNYFHWQRTVNGSLATCNTYAAIQVAADALLGVQAQMPLVVAAFHAPHVPTHQPPPELTTIPPSLDPTILKLMMIEAMDTCLGRLVHEAEKRGYLVLFASDNGSAQVGKGTLYERGLRVPLLAYGAGVAQGVSSAMVQGTDLYATILELLSISGGTQDSTSFATDLLGGVQTSRAYLHASRWPELGQPPTLATWDRTARDARWHLISNDGGTTEELYDLHADPGEQTNLWNGTPTQEQIVAHDRLASQLAT